MCRVNIFSVFRTSQTVRKRLSQTNIFSLFSTGLGRGGRATTRVEYVRLVGSNELGGHAELAIAKSKEHRGGCETPSSEPGRIWSGLFFQGYVKIGQPIIFGTIHFGNLYLRKPRLTIFKKSLFVKNS